MRRAVLIASLAFWVGMAAIWGSALWQAPPAAESAADMLDPLPRFTAGQVAEHGSVASCWLIIAGKIYDVTDYIGLHPADPRTILQYCGGEATRAFETKDRGRPHSARARSLLDRYLVGMLSAE